MSNQAKDWQEGSYTVRVKDGEVEVSTIRTVTKTYLTCATDVHKKYVATARCAPEDEFNLSMGVALAMDRLSKKLAEANKTIKVGDKVKIKNAGLIYDGYAAWVSKNVSNIKEVARYAYCGNPDTNYVYEVIAIAPHSEENRENLAYIKEIDGVFFPCFLIDLAGLEKM